MLTNFDWKGAIVTGLTAAVVIAVIKTTGLQKGIPVLKNM